MRWRAVAASELLLRERSLQPQRRALCLRHAAAHVPILCPGNLVCPPDRRPRRRRHHGHAARRRLRRNGRRWRGPSRGRLRFLPSLGPVHHAQVIHISMTPLVTGARRELTLEPVVRGPWSWRLPERTRCFHRTQESCTVSCHFCRGTCALGTSGRTPSRDKPTAYVQSSANLF